jgi:hypothetical protein
MKELRERSGNYHTNSPLVSFLYELMRDHLTPGVVEKIVLDSRRDQSPWFLTNGWLAQYAEDLANRLLPEEEKDHAH